MSSAALGFLDSSAHGCTPLPWSWKLKAIGLLHDIREETHALVDALAKWRHYLEGAAPFTMKTGGIPICEASTEH